MSFSYMSGRGRGNAGVVTVTQINCAPNIPTLPSPENGSDNQDLSITLSWTGGDPNNRDSVTYDVYFGTSTNPTTLIETKITDTNCNVSDLGYSTAYYWKVIATDSHGVATSSPVWYFVTIPIPEIVYVYDTFTDDDETTLPNHTPDIHPALSAWESVTSTPLDIANESARIRAGYDETRACVIDAGVTEYLVVSADLQVNVYESGYEESYAALLLFYASDSEYWMAKLADTTFTLYEMVNGVPTQRAQITGLTYGQAYHAIVEYNGYVFTLKIGGQTVSYDSVPNQYSGETKFGLQFYSSSVDVIADEFKVARIP